MTPAEELDRVTGARVGGDPPAGLLLDRLRLPGGERELERAREVMRAVLAGADLPGWFVAQCLDDSAVQTCTLDRWSLRAWRFWLEPENRRWWWWSAAAGPEGIDLEVLVRAQPYLRGSLDWLFKAAAAPA